MLRFRVGTSQRIGRRIRLFEGIGISRRGIRPYIGMSERIGRMRFSITEGFGRHARRRGHHYFLGIVLCIVAIVVLVHMVGR
jgi:hypothetical protein